MMCKIMKNKCENEKSRKFEEELNNCNTNINVFIRLFNMWSDMDSKERGECIENKQKEGNEMKRVEQKMLENRYEII